MVERTCCGQAALGQIHPAGDEELGYYVSQYSSTYSLTKGYCHKCSSWSRARGEGLYSQTPYLSTYAPNQFIKVCLEPTERLEPP